MYNLIVFRLSTYFYTKPIRYKICDKHIALTSLGRHRTMDQDFFCRQPVVDSLVVNLGFLDKNRITRFSWKRSIKLFIQLIYYNLFTTDDLLYEGNSFRPSSLTYFITMWAFSFPDSSRNYFYYLLLLLLMMMMVVVLLL